MKFLIQHNLMDKEQLQLTKAAVEHYPHEFVGLIPFSREITSTEPLTGTKYIPYGSTLLTNLDYELKWEGLYFDLAKFNYEAAASNRDDMMNAQFIKPLNVTIEFLHTRPDNELWFIRPSEDLKQFSGQIIEAKECREWLKDAMECDMSGTYKMEPETMIVLAEPQTIQAEWRWFVVGGEIVDGSMYRANGRLIKNHETETGVIKEAQKFADKWVPSPCCVMDTALVDDKIKVIEFNCINSSGFYNHNVSKIFSALYDYSINR